MYVHPCARLTFGRKFARRRIGKYPTFHLENANCYPDRLDISLPNSLVRYVRGVIHPSGAVKPEPHVDNSVVCRKRERQVNSTRGDSIPDHLHASLSGEGRLLGLITRLRFIYICLTGFLDLRDHRHLYYRCRRKEQLIYIWNICEN